MLFVGVFGVIDDFLVFAELRVLKANPDDKQKEGHDQRNVENGVDPDELGVDQIVIRVVDGAQLHRHEAKENPKQIRAHERVGQNGKGPRVSGGSLFLKTRNQHEHAEDAQRNQQNGQERAAEGRNDHQRDHRREGDWESAETY